MILFDPVQLGRQPWEAASRRLSWRGILRWFRMRGECDGNENTRLTRRLYVSETMIVFIISFTWSVECDRQSRWSVTEERP